MSHAFAAIDSTIFPINSLMPIPKAANRMRIQSAHQSPGRYFVMARVQIRVENIPAATIAEIGMSPPINERIKIDGRRAAANKHIEARTHVGTLKMDFLLGIASILLISEER